MANRMEISDVALLHAMTPAEVEVRITAGPSTASSAASGASRSVLPSAQRASINRSRPSTRPRFVRPARNASKRDRKADAVPGSRTATRCGDFGACANERTPASASQAPPAASNARRSARSGAFVQPRQHELAVAERFGGGKPAVGGAEHAFEQLVARLVRRHFLAQEAGDIDVDV